MCIPRLSPTRSAARKRSPIRSRCEFEFPTGTPDIYHYEVAVIGKLKPGRTMDLTARTTNDVLTLERRDSCRKILGIVGERHPAVFDHILMFYDQARLLFTSKNAHRMHIACS
ncbi:hypothetical protein L596_007903 [Steinernema carpocapsae]|nr:hypothetical protein L596_007903 [Steinernema carpocapsae]